MSYSLYLFFGILPSIIWLLFYLRRDAHPESNRMVLKIFFYGMLAALPAVLLQMGVLSFLEKLKFSSSLLIFLNVFIGAALIEEFLKYLVVREKVLDHSEFDEPVDIMLYMIIAALGFAAAENILLLFSLDSVFLFTVFTSILRFLGATLLHTLCSGIFGYFWALAIFETKKRKRLLAAGFSQAVILHGIYNFSIMKLSDKFSFLTFILILITVLVCLLIILYSFFKKLKKMKSVCKIY